MKPIRKAVAGLTVGAALAFAWIGGGSLVRNAQFAYAQEQVEATRQQIANVQDMAAVFKAVGKAVEPSVVKIDVTKTTRQTGRFHQQIPDALRPFMPDTDGDGEPDAPEGFNIPDMPERFRQRGTGSGVIVESDGSTAYIVTNNHVVGGATEMLVNLADGREVHGATLVGTDPKSDLAVIRVNAERVIPAKWGDSDKLEKGDIVMAFGSPFGYVGSMTQGIVSALNRQAGIIAQSSRYAYENFIQVDAPINPGNSGGPLVNLRGEVVGINTAIATENGAFQGVGFAIPSNQAKAIYEAIKSKGRVVRGWLGVEIRDVTQFVDEVRALGYQESSGVLVKGMMVNAPADEKLQPADIITAMNGKKVSTVTELRNTIAMTAPGTDVTLKVFRDGKYTDVVVKLGEQPDDRRMVAQADEEQNKPEINKTATAEALGLRVEPVTPARLRQHRLDENAKGALVTGVIPGSLAMRSGIAAGDMITRVDDTPINSPEELEEALSSKDLSKGVRVFWKNRESTRYAFIKSTDRQ
jgi:serine protease Do